MAISQVSTPFFLLSTINTEQGRTTHGKFQLMTLLAYSKIKCLLFIIHSSKNSYAHVLFLKEKNSHYCFENKKRELAVWVTVWQTGPCQKISLPSCWEGSVCLLESASGILCINFNIAIRFSSWNVARTTVQRYVMVINI